jgi:UDP-N-acetylmuramate-alanine ligase
MLLAGIVGHEGKSKTANLINSILSLSGKKTSIIDSRSLVELGRYKIKGYMLELGKSGVDILIIKVNLSDVEKEIFNYVQFDIMIYINKADDLVGAHSKNYTELIKKIFSQLGEKSIVIVNVDDIDFVQHLQGLEHYTITYGFNSKASVTASSVGDMVLKDNFMCCLQRSVSAKDGSFVEPQEYKMKVDSVGIDVYDVLAAAAFAIVNGVDLNNVK